MSKAANNKIANELADLLSRAWNNSIHVQYRTDGDGYTYYDLYSFDESWSAQVRWHTETSRWLVM